MPSLFPELTPMIPSWRGRKGSVDVVTEEGHGGASREDAGVPVSLSLFAYGAQCPGIGLQQQRTFASALNESLVSVGSKDAKGYSGKNHLGERGAREDCELAAVASKREHPCQEQRGELASHDGDSLVWCSTWLFHVFL